MLKTYDLAGEGMPPDIRTKIYFLAEQLRVLPDLLPEVDSVANLRRGGPSYHVAEAFYNFQPSSLRDLVGSSDYVLKRWKIDSLFGEGFEDSLVWTLYRSKLEVP